MKWFKHYTDMRNSNSVNAFIEDRGLDDYARWIFLLEFISERFDGVSTSICIPIQVGLQVTRIHGRSRFESFIKSCSIHFHFTLNTIDNGFEINYPKLLKIKDNHTKNLQVASKLLTKNLPLDKEEDKEEDKEKEEEEDKEKEYLKKRTKRVSMIKEISKEKTLGSKIWDSYHDAFCQRYGVEPTRNSKTNSMCKAIGERIGLDAIELVKFYVSHNDSWFLKRQHDLGSLLNNAEGIHTQMKRNKPVTSVDVRNFEKISETDALLEKINRGEV